MRIHLSRRIMAAAFAVVALGAASSTLPAQAATTSHSSATHQSTVAQPAAGPGSGMHMMVRDWVW